MQARTSNATAIADNISKGKTAWVNGALITGTGVDNEVYYAQGFEKGQQESLINLSITLESSSIISSYDRGGMCSYVSTITLYIINDIPTISSSSVSGSATRLYEGSSGYTYWSNSATYTIKK